MSTPHAPKLAALAFEITAGNGVPTEAHLLPVGPFRATDGRPEDADAWQLDATIATAVIARMADAKNDTLIDYEHQSLRAEWNGQPVIAAGWFHDMEWRDSKGLFAVGVDWTTKAKTHIAAKEYRYISTVFYYYERTGEVLEIISVALTNTPALDGLNSLGEQDIAALSKRFSLPNLTNPEIAMPDTAQIAALTVERDGLTNKVAALTIERDSLSTQLAALTTEHDTLKTRVDAVDAEKAQAALAAEQIQKADLVKAALTDGRLPPALKDWAEKRSLADLTEYLGSVNPLALLNKQAGDEHKTNTAALSKEQADIAAKLGVTAEEFLATQQKNAD